MSDLFAGHMSPLERAKAKYRPLQSVDELAGIERERSYPIRAGFKGAETSRAAAQSIDASLLRGKVLRIFELRGHCTADEVAEALNISVLSIRPRCSELRALGKLVDAGYRRPNKSGRSAAVLKAVLP